MSTISTEKARARAAIEALKRTENEARKRFLLRMMIDGIAKLDQSRRAYEKCLAQPTSPKARRYAKIFRKFVSRLDTMRRDLTSIRSGVEFLGKLEPFDPTIAKAVDDLGADVQRRRDFFSRLLIGLDGGKPALKKPGRPRPDYGDLNETGRGVIDALLSEGLVKNKAAAAREVVNYLKRHSTRPLPKGFTARSLSRPTSKSATK